MSREPIVIAGAGGHAKVVIDQLRRLDVYDLIGCVAQQGEGEICGVPIIGDDSALPELRRSGVRYAFPAVGSNETRSRLSAKLTMLGFELITLISPSASVSGYARLGNGVVVMPGAVVQADTRIGDLTIVNTGATIDHDCWIGTACHIAPGCHLAGSVTVGDDSFLGVGTQVIDGIRIGSRCLLGAGSVVVSDIPDGSFALGVPAKLRAQEGDRHDVVIPDRKADPERE
jgi:UDP-perosamine 4-acetyltransferase